MTGNAGRAARRIAAGGMRPKTDVRHPMYETGDKLHALREAVAGDPAMVDDPALGTLLDRLSRTHDALRRHLDAHYNWD